MIVLYGHLSFCLRSIKVVSAELAPGRHRDEFINSWNRHVQRSLTIGVTARCFCAAPYGNVHTSSLQETRLGQSVGTQALYLEAIKLHNGTQKVNLFTFMTNYYTTPTFQ